MRLHLQAISEDIVATKSEALLATDFTWWLAEVQEVRFTQYCDYEVIMDSLTKLLYNLQPLLRRCGAAWSTSEQSHDGFNTVVDIIEKKLEEIKPAGSKQPSAKKTDDKDKKRKPSAGQPTTRFARSLFPAVR